MAEANPMLTIDAMTFDSARLALAQGEAAIGLARPCSTWPA